MSELGHSTCVRAFVPRCKFSGKYQFQLNLSPAAPHKNWALRCAVIAGRGNPDFRLAGRNWQTPQWYTIKGKANMTKDQTAAEIDMRHATDSWMTA